MSASVSCTAMAAMAEGKAPLYANDDDHEGVASWAPADAAEATLIYAGVAPVSLHNSPEKLYLARSTPRYSKDDLSCLSEALYHEARGEGRKGQAAVAEVILNRVDSRRFPTTVCGVVNQKSQFSYTIGGKKPIRNKSAYARVREVARAALAGAPRNLTGGATYFHTPSVRPKWANRFQRTVRIGSHIFYRTGQRLASN